MDLQKPFFAAFIITYERADILPGTIAALFAQTFPPQKILVVDNSSGYTTRDYLQEVQDTRVSYYRVGYNSGPAGAARIGLMQLAKEGYEWIYWGDDNDPPRDELIFEQHLNLVRNLEKIGIVGSVGGKFIHRRARTTGFTTGEMKKITDADYVAGGMQMIVHAAVVHAGVLPTEKLFFGFEELDFCLQVKKAGFRIVFDGERIRQDRFARGLTAPDYKYKATSFGKAQVIGRQYYSIRNMLFILRRNGYFTGYFFLMFKTILKSVLAFRFGFRYGISMARIQYQAVWDHITGSYGKRI